MKSKLDWQDVAWSRKCPDGVKFKYAVIYVDTSPNFWKHPIKWLKWKRGSQPLVACIELDQDQNDSLKLLNTNELEHKNTKKPLFQ